MKLNITLLFLLLGAAFVSGQSDKERAEIIKSNNQVHLQQMVVDLQNKAIKDQERALEFSKANDIPMFKENQDGTFDHELHRQSLTFSSKKSPLFLTDCKCKPIF